METMAPIEKTDISVASVDVVLAGELTSPGQGAPLVVLCHGIPLSSPDPADPGYALLCDRLAESGYAALFVNFRGCGDSTGDFHLGGWYRDLCSVMGFAREQLSFPKLYLAGFSAGGSLAIKYASEHGNVDGVAAFASPSRLTEVFPRQNLLMLIEAARDIGIIKDTFFPPTPDWFFADIAANEAIDYVAGVSPVPLLIVHGESDELVPIKQARELFEAAGDPKELVTLPGGEHRLRNDPRAMENLLAWLENW
jgi:alpha-beta hydrolase superfamily lysophospholipase